ncbi:HAD family hydrolase [Celerinatantimonas diazotrophica]|uniref:Putative hydrolase of the HAD superfamily n=1 Tax=Celerinatantimonas diazotrophica TaxID=412034 RepID=A0A4R1K254_9GAMM|nr:HAD-IA family hydrolase [Celerinatantimonas diazotrophica]TCK58000.1 putative hydrolase of the HAD superfamily [Celerinatantimonas diazotrophica]CAG9297931.1 Phosphoglycolate phosphatase [Celerinatantimonas diazotrophica]
MIKAIYFDLDNTLVDRIASIERFARTFVAHYSDYLVSVSWHKVASLIQQVDNGGYLAKGSKYKKIYEAIGCELRSSLLWSKEISSSEITTYWREQFPKSTVEMPGANRLLNWLFDNGYYIGIISNGSKLSRENTLKSTSFNGLISNLVSSEEFGVKKPNPDIFIKTANKAGFSPQECVYVGDHPVIDSQGALDAGMYSVLLTGFNSELAVPDNCFKIHYLSELTRVLKTP